MSEKPIPTMGKSQLGNHPDLESLIKSEYPNEFAEIHKLAFNRKIMGSFRYGLFEKTDLSKYDCVGEAIKRINKYKLDSNLEHLVDAYNLIRLQYAYAKRYLNHSLGSIDDGEHAKHVK